MQHLCVCPALRMLSHMGGGGGGRLEEGTLPATTGGSPAQPAGPACLDSKSSYQSGAPGSSQSSVLVCKTQVCAFPLLPSPPPSPHVLSSCGLNELCVYMLGMGHRGVSCCPWDHRRFWDWRSSKPPTPWFVKGSPRFRGSALPASLPRSRPPWEFARAPATKHSGLHGFIRNLLS